MIKLQKGGQPQVLADECRRVDARGFGKAGDRPASDENGEGALQPS